MRFGERVRQLRMQKRFGQRALAHAVGVNFTYISKIENGKLDFGDYPSEELILRLAEALDVDAEEMLILAEKIPARVRKRVLERPDAFGRLAKLDDASLDRLLHHLEDLSLNRD